ncbi:MAG: type II toxin-antitoxin system RelE/ParE family toxin [Ruminococcus sp.]|nr:type II toxin-antitoxin system RelE/ParE family toxin [Ruminococcus sp.]
MGLDDNDLRRLQEEPLFDPEKGDVMQGTGSLRKLRFAFEGQGKSGRVRVCYVDFAVYESIYLITAYPKSEKDNLSKSERSSIAKLIKALERTLCEKE